MHRCNRPVHLAPGRCKKQKATARRARASVSFRNGKHAEYPRLLLSGDSFALASRHSAVPGRCSLQQCCRPHVSRVASADGPAQAPSTHVACRALPDFFCPWSARGYLHDEGANRRAVRKAGCAFPGSDEAYEFSPVRLANESKKLRRTDPRSRCAARIDLPSFPALHVRTSRPRQRHPLPALE